MKIQTNEIPSDFHGSDVDAVAAFFHIAPSDMVSFAANVNPLGISPRLREQLAANIDVITTYPQRDYGALRSAIGNYVNVSPDTVIVGNGSTELISGVIKSICPKDAVLIAPSYSEYEREVGLCGGHLRYYPLCKDQNWLLDVAGLVEFFRPDTDMVILCNPNNPTANAISVTSLRQLLDACTKRSITVMIDETYIEFSEHQEQIEAIPLTKEYDNLVVLRGVSKFFAAPGLRLGYGITGSASLRDAINAGKDPWTINSLAAKAGEILFTDTDYMEQTRTLIATEKDKFANALRATGKVCVYPSESNFLLIELLTDDITAADCFAACAKQGLMIRDCTNFPYLGDKYIRICMMSPQDNERLRNVLLTLL